MKNFIGVFCAILFTASTVWATEGMWIPSVLGAVYDDMKAAGLRLSEEDLYSVNQSSLKDAIVLFGGGCTAEIVSNQGLLFTNHHCGFDYIQSHSSLKNDYLKNGFWAKNSSEELPCEGLSVVFIVRMDDITERVRAGVSDKLNADEFKAIVDRNKRQIEAEYMQKEPGLGVVIRAFNYGNQYFAMLTKTYSDVRLVGAPPSEIGKFGGDLDNWVWPRHTGDFSVFRIYADEKNQPAKYNVNNKPFVPAHYLPINIGGVKEGDFSMVYGFPGRTEHLLTSYSVDLVMNELNPMRIDMRDQTIAVLENRMRSSDAIRIKYAAKQSDVANAWKKWKGQQIGLTNINAVELKRGQEERFRLAAANDAKYQRAGEALERLSKLIEQNTQPTLEYNKFVEYFYYGPELYAFSQEFASLIEGYEGLSKKPDSLKQVVTELKSKARAFYKNFDLATEMEIFSRLEPLYSNKYVFDGKVDFSKLGPLSSEQVAAVYMKSFFRDSTVLFPLLDKFGKSARKKLSQDYFYANATAMVEEINEKIKPAMARKQQLIDFEMQIYTAAYTQWSGQVDWCDANSTLRLTYGKVSGSAPTDGASYRYYTTADGILQKYRTGAADYAIQPRLKELLEKREYGQYADATGELRTCYTGSNHTTGGNSGSPALNAKGELTGINFDRSWESTMSDIVYNPEICRNIMVDARYVLWVIDVYAGAGYLLNEMKIVR